MKLEMTNYPCAHCKFGHYFDDEDVAKTILENREEFKKWLDRIRWHACSERLPEEGKQVLVSGYDTYGKKVTIARYQGEYGWTCGLVSAWQELPSPYIKEMKILDL